MGQMQESQNLCKYMKQQYVVLPYLRYQNPVILSWKQLNVSQEPTHLEPNLLKYNRFGLILEFWVYKEQTVLKLSKETHPSFGSNRSN